MAEAKPLGLLTFQQAIRGGVRPNLFQVSHTWDIPGVTPPDNQIDGVEDAVGYMCKSAALPATYFSGFQRRGFSAVLWCGDLDCPDDSGESLGDGKPIIQG